MLLDVLAHHAFQVFGVVEEGFYGSQGVLKHIERLLAGLARESLHTANARGHAALTGDFEEAHLARAMCVDTSTELTTGTKAHHSHLVAILLAEEGDGSQFLGLLYGRITVLVQGEVLAYHVVDDTLYLPQFLGSHLLEMGEVETQDIGTDKGALLLHVVTQDLLQRVVQQVGGRMVGGTAVAPVYIHAGHEVRLQVLGQLLHDVHALLVLSFGVYDFDGLFL